MVDSEMEDSISVGGWKMNNSGETSSSTSTSLKDHDRLLPIANVGRIMKKILPANAKISKDAKETVQECVSEFISFITGEASDKCQRERRKTINGDDLLWAMTTLGFEEYVEPLKVYLQRFRDLEGEKNAMMASGSSNSSSSRQQGGGGGEKELLMMMGNHEMKQQYFGRSYHHQHHSDGKTNSVLYSTGSGSSAGRPIID